MELNKLEDSPFMTGKRRGQEMRGRRMGKRKSLTGYTSLNDMIYFGKKIIASGYGRYYIPEFYIEEEFRPFDKYIKVRITITELSKKGRK